jgi:hypothetical protein
MVASIDTSVFAFWVCEMRFSTINAVTPASTLAHAIILGLALAVPLLYFTEPLPKRQRPLRPSGRSTCQTTTLSLEVLKAA